MNKKLIEMAQVAKYKPNIILASLLSVVFVLMGSFAGLIFNVPVSNPAYDVAINNLVFGFIGISLIVFLYVKFVEGRPISSMGFSRRGFLKKYLIGFIVGLIMFSLAVILGSVLGGYKISVSASGIKLDVLLVILFGFLIQGSAEEIVFRGWLLPIVGSRYKVSIAIILSSLLFALLHALNPGITILPVINLILFGVFAAMYSLHEEGLWGICGMHSAWNWVQGSVFGVKVSGTSLPGGSVLVSKPVEGMDLISGGLFGVEGSILCSIIFLAATIYLVYKMRNK